MTACSLLMTGCRLLSTSTPPSRIQPFRAVFSQFHFVAAIQILDNFEGIVREHYSNLETGELINQTTSAFEEAGL